MSTLDTSQQMADHTPSLYLDRMQLFTSILIQNADLSHHSEITLQDVPKLKYTLRLLVDNEERELQRMDNRTWEPAQRLYVPCFFDRCTYQNLCTCRDASPTSKMRIEIQLKSGPLQWGKKEQVSTEIDLKALFDEYWSAKAHEFPVRGQSESPMSSLIADREAQTTLSLGNLVSLWNYCFPQKLTFVPWQLPTASCLYCSHRRNLYAPRSINWRDC